MILLMILLPFASIKWDYLPLDKPNLHFCLNWVLTGPTNTVFLEFPKKEHYCAGKH